MCQKWGSASPHSHSWLISHPNDGLDSNYCRNPGGLYHTMWCMTTDALVPKEECIPLSNILNYENQSGSCKKAYDGSDGNAHEMQDRGLYMSNNYGLSLTLQ